MTEILDQELSEKPKLNIARIVNFTLLGIVVMTVFYTIWRVNSSIRLNNSLLLPNYSAYYLHHKLINYTVVQFLGIILAMFPTYKGRHSFSIIFIICFMLLGFLLKDSSHFYRWFIPM